MDSAGNRPQSTGCNDGCNQSPAGEFRVRIDPGNQSSQKLFERLGAVPNGISSLFLQEEELQQKCEEENLHLIDEDVIALAQKFNVEPRKLLSHVLEYKLVWPENIAKDYD